MNRREYNRQWMAAFRERQQATRSAACACPICVRRRTPPALGEAPHTYELSPRALSTLYRLAREFDELSGDDLWRAEDFMVYVDASGHDLP